MKPQVVDTLAGELRLHPGRPRPANIESTRRDYAALLTRGIPADQVSAVLGNLYTLCGHAHRLCSEMAVAAARGRPRAADPAEVARLQRDTASEHVRRMTLDWPRQLGAGSSVASIEEEARLALVQCPIVLRASEPSSSTAPELHPGLLHWLEASILQTPASEWLACWDQEPAGSLRSWSESSSSWLARLLNHARSMADVQTSSATGLRVHASDMGLRLLADCMGSKPEFTRTPVWRGECAETGTWTRLRQPMPPLVDTAWLKLGSRVAELARLATTPTPAAAGDELLDAGCLALARYEGIAWVEMARGLLLHHVVLDDDGHQAQVGACHVLAPTEWNFHPRGPVAQVLESMEARPDVSTRCELELLVAAYDPCIRHELVCEEEVAMTQNAAITESAHA